MQGQAHRLDDEKARFVDHCVNAKENGMRNVLFHPAVTGSLALAIRNGQAWAQEKAW